MTCRYDFRINKFFVGRKNQSGVSENNVQTDHQLLMHHDGSWLLIKNVFFLMPNFDAK